MMLELDCLDEPLEFDDSEVIEQEGAKAFDASLLDTDNPYPKGDKYDGSPWAMWDDGWWQAADAWMRQQYPDRF
jgi:hypothetical protein